jgi:hypothetical protein
MSTTFGIPQRQVELDKIINKDGEIYDYIDTSFFEKVFYRGGYSRWLNPLSSRLSDDTRIFPLDNSAQGIYTIGDARKFLKEKENEANSQI